MLICADFLMQRTSLPKQTANALRWHTQRLNRQHGAVTMTHRHLCGPPVLSLGFSFRRNRRDCMRRPNINGRHMNASRPRMPQPGCACRVRDGSHHHPHRSPVRSGTYSIAMKNSAHIVMVSYCMHSSAHPRIGNHRDCMVCRQRSYSIYGRHPGLKATII